MKLTIFAIVNMRGTVLLGVRYLNTVLTNAIATIKNKIVQSALVNRVPFVFRGRVCTPSSLLNNLVFCDLCELSTLPLCVGVLVSSSVVFNLHL